MNQDMKQLKKENKGLSYPDSAKYVNTTLVGDRIVNAIKREIKSSFSTDDEGILQFNKNGYQASVNDILNAIDEVYKKICK